MYNVQNATKGGNEAFKLLCNVSVMSDRKGIIGKNVEFIEKKYNCCVDNFKCLHVDDNMKARGLLIRELSECISNDSMIDNWTHQEIKYFIEYIACY